MSNTSPRPSANTGKLATADLRGFEARRLQTLQDQTRLSQEAIQVASGIIQCAMEAGQSHARVQTIFLSRAQFTYTQNVSSDTFQLYDCYTLVPMVGIEKRVCFSSCIRDFVMWLREQGLRYMCTSQKNAGNILSSFVHIEAYWIPEQPAPASARALSLWNTVYTQKCVDATMVPAWNQRCADAIRRGASSFIVCTLYRHSDFYPISETNSLQGIVCKQCPRHHLTLQPLEKKEDYVLNPKFNIMLQWTRELGYAWTLAMPILEESEWAYFIVLMDPLGT